MTIDEATKPEIAKLWSMISAEPWLHFGDASPKTLEEFEALLESKLVFAVRTGKKLVGAVGFDPLETALAGVHFIPEVRGSTLPGAAMRRVIATLFALGVSEIKVRYFASNVRVHKFMRKLGLSFEGVKGEALQNGSPVAIIGGVFSAERIKANAGAIRAN